jgi:hypothetical protein
MRSTRPVYSTIFFLFLTFLVSPIITRAADEDPDEYDVKARVVRISLLTGEVNLKRNGNTDWERARLNSPLVEGDLISTGSTDPESRVEIQIDARNFVRLGANSILRIVTLRAEGVALSLVEGTASLRLAEFDRDHEYFEVDAPKTTLAAEKSGLYRIDVGKDGHVRLTARDGGRARIYSEKSGFALRDGRTAELIIDGADAGEWEMLVAGQRDSWDQWLDDRERYLAQRLRYDTQYYDNYVWGAEDLDAYGAWSYTNDYGWIWRPHTTVINSYGNWAPYRYGQWAWVSPYGWTWVGNEPWGWAPYHYGRWVYYNNYWAWCPRSQYHRHRSWWRPALVAFVSVHLSFGDSYCWYPLGYHQRDPRSRNYRHGDRHGGDDRRDRRDRGGDHDGNWRGVTGIPRRDFGGHNQRPRLPDVDVGRRVVNAEPLPELPGRPARPDRDINRPVPGDGTERRTVARRGRDLPGIDVPDRPTGAADRSPGVPLDTELRRSRVWNGREGRRQFPDPTGGAGGVEERPTGAVERPASPPREVAPRNDGGRGEDRIPGSERPQRTDRRIPQETTPGAEPIDPERAPERVPVKIPSNDAPVERPTRPAPYERPAPVDNGEGRERRGGRSEDYTPRSAPSERRSEPTPRSEPAPRNDPPPQRSEPAPRNDPPPQRSEPAPRNDPPPQRSEPPPRNDPPARSEPARDNEERHVHKSKDPR